MQELAKTIITEVERAVIGKRDKIERILLAMTAGGHVLLEDLPGVGKTTIALAFSRALQLSYKRIQFTPDVLPADVVGFTVYNQQTGKFEYQPGPVLSNLFLADEINRTSSKTQSALLEAMEEGQVTVDGETYQIPKPFTVLATQNPVGSAGTQLLPESQMDRFLIRLSVGYPEIADEMVIMRTRQGEDPMKYVRPVASAEDLLKMHAQVEAVYTSEEIFRFVASLAAATRHHELIRMGVSPRGSLALARMSRAYAWYEGRDYVLPTDVQAMMDDTLAHRLVLSPKARASGLSAVELLHQVTADVAVPKIV